MHKSQPIRKSLQLFYVCTDYRVFVLTIITGTSVYCFGYYLQQFERQPKWHIFRFMINALCIIIGFTSEYNPTSDPSRISLAFGLLAGILCSVVYSTFLLRIFWKPYLWPQVQSVNEILDNNFKLVGDSFALMKLQMMVSQLLRIGSKL